MSELVWKTIEPELCDVIAGGTPSTDNKEFWDGDVLWITPSDMSRCQGVYIFDSDRKITDKGIKYATGKLLPAGSVVISCRAPVGYCCLPDKPFTTNQGCKTLICKGVDAGYLYYYLLNSTDKLIRVSSGTTFLELSKKELSRFSVYLPKDKNEQHKIAEVLMALDEVIDRTREIIEKYRNVKKGLLQDLFNEGEIVSLADKRYFQLNPSIRRLPNVFYYIDLESVVDGLLVLHKTERKEYAPSRAQRVLRKNDILFQMVRPYQQNNLFFDLESDLPYVASTGYAQIRTTQNPKYVYYAMHTYGYVSKVIQSCTGSNYPAINSTKLSQIEFRLPERNVQDEIAGYLSDTDKMIRVEMNHLEKYESIKLGLLQDLLSGRVDVTPLM